MRYTLWQLAAAILLATPWCDAPAQGVAPWWLDTATTRAIVCRRDTSAAALALAPQGLSYAVQNGTDPRRKQREMQFAFDSAGRLSDLSVFATDVDNGVSRVDVFMARRGTDGALVGRIVSTDTSGDVGGGEVVLRPKGRVRMRLATSAERAAAERLGAWFWSHRCGTTSESARSSQ